MQKGRQSFHNEQNGNWENSKKVKDDGQKDETAKVSRWKAEAHHHGPKHLWQLCSQNMQDIKK